MGILKKGKRLFLLIAMVVAAAQAYALPNKCLTKAEAQAITFQWTDAAGVKHNATLADRATDPRHIIALLKEAYTNAKVPGIWQSAYNSSGERENDAYYGQIQYKNGTKSGTVTAWNITSAPKPTNEGYSLFLMTIKDSYAGSYGIEYTDMTYTNLVNYFNDVIESAQLLTDGWRTDNTTEPGMAFSVSGEVSRFFFLSKGKARDNKQTAAEYGAKPFYRMFEEFSPYDSQATGTTITDFYASLLAGDRYPVEHDCNTIIGRKHYFLMDGNSAKTRYNVNGLTFVIPDKRLAYFTVSGRNKGATTDGRCDVFGTTTTTAFANYNPSHAPTMFLYAINLQADAQVLSESDHTYTVNLKWTSTDKNADQTFYIYRVVDGKVEDTPINSEPLHNVYSWSETVEQQTSGVTYTYVVRGRPDLAQFTNVTSNTSSVIIPGYDPQERLVLAISNNYESEYDFDAQCNRYANYIVLNNGVGTTVTSDFLQVGSKFEFHRYEQGSDTPDKIVATAQITALTSSSCSYQVTYNYQDGADNSKYPATTGNFSIASNKEVQFGNFTICDQFSASTASNSHAPKYTYQVSLESAKPFIDLDGSSTTKVYSNISEVNIYKVDYSSPALTMTTEQADADTDVFNLIPLDDSLPFTFAAYNDRNVLNYILTCDGETTGIYAQNTNDGKYAVHNIDSEEKQSADAVTLIDALPEAYDNFSYMPLIETYRNDGSANRNSYGSTITPIKCPSVDVTVVNKVRSNDTFDNDKGRYYRADLQITPNLPSGTSNYCVRVWRICDKAMESQSRYQYRLNQAVPVYEDKEGEDDYLLDGDNMVFGAENTKTGESLTAKFVVRLYAISDTPSDASAKRLAPSAPIVYVGQKTIDVTFDNSVKTAIEEVKNDAPVVSRTYYNLVGQGATKPWSGVNIIIDTHSDGSTTSTKAVY